VAGLAFLLYKEWIDVKWMDKENATEARITNVAGQVGHALNNTASQFAAHSTKVEAAGLPVAASSPSSTAVKDITPPDTATISVVDGNNAPVQNGGTTLSNKIAFTLQGT
jgi:hypothetical protein